MGLCCSGSKILKIQPNGLKIKYVYIQIQVSPAAVRFLFKISFPAKWLENKNSSTDQLAQKVLHLPVTAIGLCCSGSKIFKTQLNGLKIKYVYKDSSFTCSSHISVGSSSHRLLDHLFKISFLAKWLENKKNFSTDQHRRYCCCGRRFFSLFLYLQNLISPRNGNWVVLFWEQNFSFLSQNSS